VTLRAPQIIWIVLAAMSLLASAYYHGKPLMRKVNLFEKLLMVSIHVGLLLWGGFFG